MKTSIFYKIFFYFSLYASFIILYLNYEIVYSPDFEKYFIYFEYFNGTVENTGLEQGSLYFFIVYFFTVTIGLFSTGITNFSLLNITVLFSNFIIYFIGVLGLKNLLNNYGFESKYIYLSLTVLNFLPTSLQLRMTFKPELLGFTLIIWGLVYLELYKQKKAILYLYLFLAISVFISTLKISIALIYFFVIVLQAPIKEIFNILIKNYKAIFLVFLLFFVLHAENFVINDKFIFNVEHEEKYNNSATVEFFTNFNSKEINDNPHKPFHNNSFRAITLLDTFSDYFELYWNSDHSNFNDSRKEFIVFIEKNSLKNEIPTLSFKKDNRTLTYIGELNSRYIGEDIGENIIDEIRSRTSFYISILFYALLVLFSFFQKKLRFILLSPFIGMLLISMSSLGVFTTKNFNPIVGDSVKTFYYSFVLTISFAILFSILLSKFRKISNHLSVITIILFLFIIGLPTGHSDELISEKLTTNSFLITCELNLAFIEIDYISNLESCNSYKKLINEKYSQNNVNFSFRKSRIPYLNILGMMYLLNFGIKSKNKQD